MPVVAGEEKNEDKPSNNDGKEGPRKRRKNAKAPKGVHTKVEVREIVTNADLLDHLVIQGSHYRHQDRRLQQQIQRYATETASRRESFAEKRYADQQSDTGRRRRRRLRRQPLPKATPMRHLEVPMAHAADSQAYSTKQYNITPICDVWPRKIRMATNVLPDHDWDQLYGDGLAQRAVYRAGAVEAEDVSSSLPDWKDEEYRTGICKPNCENPFQDLIYKAWERAMHAASSVVAIPASGSKPPESDAPEAAEVNAEATEDNPEATEANTEAAEANAEVNPEAAEVTADATEVNPKATEVDSSVRSRSHAEAECKKYDLDLDETVYSTLAVSRCPSCEFKECSSIDELKNHYYGTETSQGCCWKIIERFREQLVLQTLECDAKNQIDHLIHLAFGAVVEHVGVDDKVVLDCFDLHNYLDDTWNHAVRNEQPDGRACHLETLEVAEGEPPLVLNQAILDSLHRRITERYSRVPK